MARQKALNSVSNNEARKAIERDIEAFLASGNKIEQVPTGVSGQTSTGRSKHIVISRRPRRAE